MRRTPRLSRPFLLPPRRTGTPDRLLLDYLVGAWELTANGNDSHTDFHHLASHSYDFDAEATDADLPTFDAAGVHLQCATYQAPLEYEGVEQWLEATYRASMSPGARDFLVCGHASFNADAFDASPTVTNPYYLFVRGNGSQEFALSVLQNGLPTAYVNDTSGDFPSVDAAGQITDALVHFFALWLQGTTLSLQVDGGTVATVETTGTLETDTSGTFLGGDTFRNSQWGTMRRWRYWVGDITDPLAALSWLRNGTTGRTYAEIAAYTG